MDKFTWTRIYAELASSLLKYKDNRSAMIELLQVVFAEVELKFPYVEFDKPVPDMDPFTVMGSFNRGISDSKRIKMLTINIHLIK